MTRISSAIVVLMLAFAAVNAQSSVGDNIKLHLKSGETLDGTVKAVDEDGLKLDIGDGIELFVRWSYTRGDKHFELRKRAADFTKLESVLKLADFCHDFAMDEQEYLVLIQALKLDPGHKEARDRLTALPKVEGAEVPPLPGTKPDEPKPDDPKPDDPKPDDPKPDDPLPPPTRGMFKVFLSFTTEDSAADEWFQEELGNLNYKFGSKADHEIRIEIDITLTLTKNPKFMGAELYAIYDGKMTWKLYKKGDKKPFAEATEKAENVRRDKKEEARTACRTSMMQDALPEMHKQMEKLR